MTGESPVLKRKYDEVSLKSMFIRIYRDWLKTVPGLVNFVPAVAYHFCLALPAAFTQPGAQLLAEPCTELGQKVGPRLPEFFRQIEW